MSSDMFGENEKYYYNSEKSNKKISIGEKFKNTFENNIYTKIIKTSPEGSIKTIEEFKEIVNSIKNDESLSLYRVNCINGEFSIREIEVDRNSYFKKGNYDLFFKSGFRRENNNLIGNGNHLLDLNIPKNSYNDHYLFVDKEMAENYGKDYSMKYKETKNLIMSTVSNSIQSKEHGLNNTLNENNGFSPENT